MGTALSKRGITSEEARQRICRHSGGVAALERLEQLFDSLAADRKITFRDFRTHFLQAVLPQMPRKLSDAIETSLHCAREMGCSSWQCKNPNCKYQYNSWSSSHCLYCREPAKRFITFDMIVQGFAVVRYGDPKERVELLYDIYSGQAEHLDAYLLRQFVSTISGEHPLPDAGLDSVLKWQCAGCQLGHNTHTITCYQCGTERPPSLGDTQSAVNRTLFLQWAAENADEPLVCWIHEFGEALGRAGASECDSSDAGGGSPADEALAPRGSQSSVGADGAESKPDLDEQSQAAVTALRHAADRLDTSPGGRTTSAEAAELTADLGPRDVVGRVFAALACEDVDHGMLQPLPPGAGGAPQTVSTRELLVTLAAITLRSQPEQLRFAFALFDEDGDGRISARERLGLLRAVASVERIHRTQSDAGRQGVAECIPPAAGGADPSDGLTVDDLIKWARNEGADWFSWVQRLAAAALAHKKPETGREERRLISALNTQASSGSPGSERYLIAREWWDEWRAATSEAGAVGGLREIDNEPLLDVTGELSRIVSAKDYVVVSPEAWRALSTWYGSRHPPVMRRLVQRGPRVKLELHPPSVVVVLSNELGRLGSLGGPQRRLSGGDGLTSDTTMQELMQTASKAHGIDPHSYSLYDAEPADPDPQVGWRLVSEGHAAQATLGQMEHGDGHVFALVPSLSADPASCTSPASQPEGLPRLTSWTRHAGTDEVPEPAHLQNMGNTCFMDACLQAFFASPILSQLFSGQHLREIAGGVANQRRLSVSGAPQVQRFDSSGGRVAVQLGRLLRKFRLHHPRQLKAEQFRNALAMHDLTRMYADGDQHDADGFWLKLTELLAGDLRVAAAYELPPLGDDDEAVGARHWAEHIMRNRSSLGALTASQHIQWLYCEQCSHRQGRPVFEIQDQKLMVTALPRQLRYLNVKLVRGALGQPALLLRLGMPDQATVGDLLKEVAALTEGQHSAEDMVLVDGPPWRRWLGERRSERDSVSRLGAEVAVHCASGLAAASRSHDVAAAVDVPQQWKCSLCTLLNEANANFCIACDTAKPEETAAEEAPLLQAPDIAVRLVHRRRAVGGPTCFRPRDPLFGQAVCAVVPSGADSEQVYRAVAERVRDLVDPHGGSPHRGEAEKRPRVDNGSLPFQLRRVTADGVTCSRCKWYLGCPGCLIRRGEGQKVDPPLAVWETVAVDWGPMAVDRAVEWKEHESRARSLKEEHAEKELSACIQRTYSDEQTTKGRCDKCGHEGLTRRKRLWRLPPLLTLTLTRQVTEQKNETMVRFPHDKLDLRPFVEPPSREIELADPLARLGSRNPELYDLWAVVNHQGASVFFGHYVAAVRMGGQWWMCDDLRPSCARMTDAEVCTKDAYMLFYRRRDCSRTPIAALCPPPSCHPVEECEVMGDEESWRGDGSVLVCPAPETPDMHCQRQTRASFNQACVVSVVDLTDGLGDPLADDALTAEITPYQDCPAGLKKGDVVVATRDLSQMKVSAWTSGVVDSVTRYSTSVWDVYVKFDGLPAANYIADPYSSLRVLKRPFLTSQGPQSKKLHRARVQLGKGEVCLGLEQALESICAGEIVRVRVAAPYLQHALPEEYSPGRLQPRRGSVPPDADADGAPPARWFWVRMHEHFPAEDISQARDGTLHKRVLRPGAEGAASPQVGDTVALTVCWDAGGDCFAELAPREARLGDGTLPVAVERTLLSMSTGESAQVKAPATEAVVDAADLPPPAAHYVHAYIHLQGVTRAADPEECSGDVAAQLAQQWADTGEEWGKRAASLQGPRSALSTGVGAPARLQARAREAYQAALRYAEAACAAAPAQHSALLGRAHLGIAHAAFAVGALPLAARHAELAETRQVEGAAELAATVRKAQEEQRSPVPPIGLQIETKPPKKQSRYACLVVDHDGDTVLLDFTLRGRRRAPFDGEIGTYTIRRESEDIGWELDTKSELRIASVAPGSAAEAAGVRPTMLLDSVAGHEVRSNAEAEERIAGVPVGVPLVVKLRSGAERVPVPRQEWLDGKQWSLYGCYPIGLADVALHPGTSVVREVAPGSRADREGLRPGAVISEVHVPTPQLRIVSVDDDEAFTAALQQSTEKFLDIVARPPGTDWQCPACGRVQAARSHCAAAECECSRTARTHGECTRGHPLVEQEAVGMSRTCHGCGRAVQRPLKQWRCRRCDFVKCPRCVGFPNRRPWNPAKDTLERGMFVVCIDHVLDSRGEQLVAQGTVCEITHRQWDAYEQRLHFTLVGGATSPITLYRPSLCEPSSEWTGADPDENIEGKWECSALGPPVLSQAELEIYRTEQQAMRIRLSPEEEYSLRPATAQDICQKPHVWEFDDQGCWRPFEAADSVELERAYLTGQPRYESTAIGAFTFNRHRDRIQYNFNREADPPTATQRNTYYANAVKNCRRILPPPFVPDFVAFTDTDPCVLYMRRTSESLLHLVRPDDGSPELCENFAKKRPPPAAPGGDDDGSDEQTWPIYQERDTSSKVLSNVRAEQQVKHTDNSAPDDIESWVQVTLKRKSERKVTGYMQRVHYDEYMGRSTRG
eukprot:TRINITY_DN3953_c0_g1_i1.p1 TRINITY_DN3953_c0_g1~~TRINITY_DN3953_c0_g1_i1.p1  ORF type:complete len:2545 (+),score=631.47 TRINITY_DN3953_c0_g1_i1:122-7756(+)